METSVMWSLHPQFKLNRFEGHGEERTRLQPLKLIKADFMNTIILSDCQRSLEYQLLICQNRFLIKAWMRNMSFLFKLKSAFYQKMEKVKKKSFIQIPKDSHCYLHIQFLSKSQSGKEILRRSAAPCSTFAYLFSCHIYQSRSSEEIS